MIEIVQDLISTGIASPLLNGSWGFLETLEAFSTGREPLGVDGVTVQEVHPMGHPMLARQVDGIGNSAAQ